MSTALIRRIVWVAVFMSAMSVCWAQKVVAWTAQLEPKDARSGEFAQIVVTAKIDPEWHIYGMVKSSADGPSASTFELADAKGLAPAGKPIEPTPGTKFDNNFNMDVAFHSGTVRFALPVQITAKSGEAISGTIKAGAQACNQSVCQRYQVEKLPFSGTVGTGAARPEFAAANLNPPTQEGNTSAAHSVKSTQKAPEAQAQDATSIQIKEAKSQGLLSFLWLAFAAGLLALLTPCVFPMIPITVSFFAKKQGDGRVTNTKGAVAYSLGIVSSFTLLGVLVTAFFGAAGLQKLATNPWVNVFLAGLFIFLALNLFGLYELQLPQSLVGKFSKGAKKEGVVGPILMGVTFSLTTFTCTVPFVGTLLLAATQGDYLYPVLGMLAFSLAFALPFFFLAMFPQLLSRLPKSGSWLATVKAFMGFLELAAALKFISNVDLVNQWGLLTRPTFISIWSTLMFLGGLYLFGWIVLGHAEEKPSIGWIRRCFGVGAFAAAIYLLAGLQGANLGTLGSFLPPEPYPGRESKGAVAAGELSWHETFSAAIEDSKASGKPIFIDFTGVTCTNCRQMEQQVFPHPAVREALAKFARAKLYTDRPQDQANADLQQKLTQSSALPIYVILDASNSKPVAVFAGSQTTGPEFAKFLADGIAKVR